MFGTESLYCLLESLVIVCGMKMHLKSLDREKVPWNCMALFNSITTYFTDDARCKWYSYITQQNVCPHLPQIEPAKKTVLAR